MKVQGTRTAVNARHRSRGLPGHCGWVVASSTPAPTQHQELPQCDTPGVPRHHAVSPPWGEGALFELRCPVVGSARCKVRAAELLFEELSFVRCFMNA